MKLPKLKNPFRALKKLRLENKRLLDENTVLACNNAALKSQRDTWRFIRDNIPNEDAARETYSQRQAMQTQTMRLSQAEELARERMLAQRDSRPLLPREAESEL